MASAELDAAPAAWVEVTVVCALGPHRVLSQTLRLPAGSTAGQALAASGLAEQLPPGLLARCTLALWGRACPADTVLLHHDRLALCRPLTVDPKEARRLRYQRDGLRKKRPPARRQRPPASDAAPEPSLLPD